MNHDFLIRPAQLNHAFESNGSSGGAGESSGLTRRSFIKRTGGATIATLVAWNLTTSMAHAKRDLTKTSYSYLVLVCTASPKPSDINAPTAKDMKPCKIAMGNSICHRIKEDTVTVSQYPSKLDFKPLDNKGFTIEAKATTVLSLEVSDGNGGWVSSSSYPPDTREADETQTVVGHTDGELKWTANKAVADNLETDAGQSGGCQGSAVTGGIGIQEGTIKARTIWAGETGNLGVNFGVKAGGVELKMDLTGTTSDSTLDWTKSDLEWSFEVMTVEDHYTWEGEQLP